MSLFARTRPATDDSGGKALFKRFALGALIIVLASASATAIAGFHEVNRFVDVFKGGQHLNLGRLIVSEPPPGKPQTLLLIGSDRRSKFARDSLTGMHGPALSDTMMLVRLDADKRATAILSLPRDLKVDIPGHGYAKLNAAFADGGPRLTVKTITALTGLTINHVIEVDFKSFKEAINSLRCIYLDVDHRYFNDNSGGGPGYATIDIKPGYQRLCGQDALDFVRYRHNDNDIVRAARQQEFLREAKAQFGIGTLLNDRGRLAQIFKKYMTSDLRSTSAILRLLNLVVASAAHPVQEVHFTAVFGPSYVYASQATVQRLVHQFLGVRPSKGPRGVLQPKSRKLRRRARQLSIGLEDASSLGKDQALQLITQHVRVFPLYYPTKRLPGSLFVGPPRAYTIATRDGKRHSSYRIVIKRGLVGEYYGLQGTTWTDPPILRKPDATRTIRGHRYLLFFDGDRLRMVAWKSGHAAYWLDNTLLETLSNRQMLAIAASCRHL
jgi:LCP family protein required for cell wall assembly